MKLTKVTSKEVKKMKSMTNWTTVKRMKDSDIDYTDSPDITELLKSGSVRLVDNSKKKRAKEYVTIKMDSDVAQALRKIGTNWQTRLNKNIKKWPSQAGLL